MAHSSPSSTSSTPTWARSPSIRVLPDESDDASPRPHMHHPHQQYEHHHHVHENQHEPSAACAAVDSAQSSVVNLAMVAAAASSAASSRYLASAGRATTEPQRQPPLRRQQSQNRSGRLATKFASVPGLSSLTRRRRKHRATPLLPLGSLGGPVPPPVPVQLVSVTAAPTTYSRLDSDRAATAPLLTGSSSSPSTASARKRRRAATTSSASLPLARCLPFLLCRRIDDDNNDGNGTFLASRSRRNRQRAATTVENVTTISGPQLVRPPRATTSTGGAEDQLASPESRTSTPVSLSAARLLRARARGRSMDSIATAGTAAFVSDVATTVNDTGSTTASGRTSPSIMLVSSESSNARASMDSMMMLPDLAGSLATPHHQSFSVTAPPSAAVTTADVPKTASVVVDPQPAVAVVVTPATEPTVPTAAVATPTTVTATTTGRSTPVGSSGHAHSRSIASMPRTPHALAMDPASAASTPWSSVPAPRIPRRDTFSSAMNSAASSFATTPVTIDDSQYDAGMSGDEDFSESVVDDAVGDYDDGPAAAAAAVAATVTTTTTTVSATMARASRSARSTSRKSESIRAVDVTAAYSVTTATISSGGPSTKQQYEQKARSHSDAATHGHGTTAHRTSSSHRTAGESTTPASTATTGAASKTTTTTHSAARSPSEPSKDGSAPGPRNPMHDAGGIGTLWAAAWRLRWAEIRPFAHALFDLVGCSREAVAEMYTLFRATRMTPQHFAVMAIYIARFLTAYRSNMLAAAAAAGARPAAIGTGGGSGSVRSHDSMARQSTTGVADRAAATFGTIRRRISKARLRLSRAPSSTSLQGLFSSASSTPNVASSITRAPGIGNNDPTNPLGLESPVAHRRHLSGSPMAPPENESLDETFSLAWTALAYEKTAVDRQSTALSMLATATLSTGSSGGGSGATATSSITDVLAARTLVVQVRLLTAATLLACKQLNDHSFTANAVAGVAQPKYISGVADLVELEMRIAMTLEFDLAVRRMHLRPLLEAVAAGAGTSRTSSSTSLAGVDSATKPPVDPAAAEAPTVIVVARSLIKLLNRTLMVLGEVDEVAALAPPTASTAPTVPASVDSSSKRAPLLSTLPPPPHAPVRQGTADSVPNTDHYHRDQEEDDAAAAAEEDVTVSHPPAFDRTESVNTVVAVPIAPAAASPAVVADVAVVPPPATATVTLVRPTSQEVVVVPTEVPTLVDMDEAEVVVVTSEDDDDSEEQVALAFHGRKQIASVDSGLGVVVSSPVSTAECLPADSGEMLSSSFPASTSVEPTPHARSLTASVVAASAGWHSSAAATPEVVVDDEYVLPSSAVTPPPTRSAQYQSSPSTPSKVSTSNTLLPVNGSSSAGMGSIGGGASAAMQALASLMTLADVSPKSLHDTMERRNSCSLEVPAPSTSSARFLSPARGAVAVPPNQDTHLAAATPVAVVDAVPPPTFAGGSSHNDTMARRHRTPSSARNSRTDLDPAMIARSASSPPPLISKSSAEPVAPPLRSRSGGPGQPPSTPSSVRSNGTSASVPRRPPRGSQWNMSTTLPTHAPDATPPVRLQLDIEANRPRVRTAPSVAASVVVGSTGPRVVTALATAPTTVHGANSSGSSSRRARSPPSPPVVTAAPASTPALAQLLSPRAAALYRAGLLFPPTSQATPISSSVPVSYGSAEGRAGSVRSFASAASSSVWQSQQSHPLQQHRQPSITATTTTAPVLNRSRRGSGAVRSTRAANVTAL
ncbi:hypothetical protein BC828DRAFT_376413 [Blastocladiella britannica]|nr:hypothetical protein BC828DRAFT_376413 [Blastocladiella britannica]